jgi:hypothetical protein
MQTLTHQLGHNFGLLHNLRGTAETDPRKYWNKKSAERVYGKLIRHEKIKEGELAVSSSVMDLYSEDASGGILQVLPGPYDIAAIEFGYTDRVTHANGGGVIQLADRSIVKAVNGDIAKLNHFSQCDDNKAALAMDHRCAKYDLGRTPLEVVRNAKATYLNDNLSFIFQT